MAIRREQRQRRQRLRGFAALIAGVLVVALAMLVVTALGGGRSSSSQSVTVGLHTTPTSHEPVAFGPAPTSAPAAPTTATEPDPGLLPQTDVRPDAASPVFVAHVGLLWQAITSDDPRRAMAFFFPLSAYKQVKGISDPEHDFTTRLVPNFDDDVHSWHAQLGPNAANAKLISTTVPSDQAQWILPGAEYNKGSYWRVYKAVLRYEVDGRNASFTIASMISWRGEWYVVHLASIR